MPLLRPEDIAKLLAVSKATVYRWVEERAIPHFKVGHLIRFDEGAVARWLESKKVCSIREAIAAARRKP